MSNNNSLFGNTPGISGMVGDYNSIKNGSYGKLMKSYYKKENASASKSSNRANKDNVIDKMIKERKNPTLSKEVTQANSKLSDSTRTLMSSLSALQSKDTYKDKASVTKALKEYVSSYNDAVESSKKTSLTNISKNIAGIMDATRENADALKDLGISMNSDGTLTLSEEALATADTGKIQELFDGEAAMSYGSKAASRLNRASGYINEANADTAAEDASKEVAATNSRSLMDTLKSVKSDELFATTKDAEGNERYDTEKIMSATEDMIKYYNATLGAARNTGTVGVTGNLSSMVQKTAKSAGELSELGITVGSDGRLSLNEDTFRSADMSKAKETLGKYATTIESDARLLNYYSQNSSEATTGYSADGGYNLNTADVVAQLYDSMQ